MPHRQWKIWSNDENIQIDQLDLMGNKYNIGNYICFNEAKRFGFYYKYINVDIFSVWKYW